MTTQWYELKTQLEQMLSKPADMYNHYIVYTLILREMNHIETKYACKSLEEAGY